MTATPQTFKQKVISNSGSAVAGTPPISCNPGCQVCRRVDLQLLVVTPSVVVKQHAQALTTAGYVWNKALDPAFSAVKRGATLPVARIASPGYLMVYYATRGCWDVWQVMQHGLTRKIMHQVNTEQYTKMQASFATAPPPKVCSRKAANLTAQLINIEGAVSVDKVWIAHAGHLWTPSTLQRYADNPTIDVAGQDGQPAGKKKLQEVRGREFSPKGVLAGKIPVSALPLNAETLEQHVADFVKVASPAYKKAFATATKMLDVERIGQAAECDKQVRAVEKASGPSGKPDLYLNKSIVLMVPDPVGVADTHNTLRAQIVSERIGWEAGGLDATGKNANPDRPWQRQSVLHASFIREHMRKQKQESAFKDLGEGAVPRTAGILVTKDEYMGILKEKEKGVDRYPGAIYARQPGKVESYKMYLPDKSAMKKIANANVEGDIVVKSTRYDKHLDWKAVEAANKVWVDQEAGWQKLLAEVDTDYVTWMTNGALDIALHYDHDDAAAWQKNEAQRDNVRTRIADAEERLKATARCYSGGALCDVSLKYFFKEFSKDERDRFHHVSAALLKPFDFIDKALSDPGMQADLYDVPFTAVDAWGKFRDTWKQMTDPLASATSALAYTALQVTTRMEQVALSPELAGKLGLQIRLKQATQKGVIWVRATALHNYLTTGSRQYTVAIRWDAGTYAAVAHREPTLAAMAIKVGQPMTPKKRFAAHRKSVSRLSDLIVAERNAMVMMEFTDTELSRLAAAQGHRMVDIVSPGWLGMPRGITRLPDEMAKAFVSKNNVDINKIKGKSGLLNCLVLFFQWRATVQSMKDVSEKEGADQVEAIFSLLGGVTGVSGVFTELATIMLTPGASEVGMPGGVEMAKVPAYLRLKLAAGILMAAGAIFDGIVSFAKAYGRLKNGDEHAGLLNAAAGSFQLAGGYSLGRGAWLAYRSAVLRRAGATMAVRAIAGMAFSLGALGTMLMGVGLIFWLVGLGISLYAMYLEDDSNEVYLRRSFFGMGHPQLEKFKGLTEEMQAFQALSLGSSVEIAWNDKWGPDEVSVELKFFKQPKTFARIVLEGFDAINGRKIKDMYIGAMPLPQLDSNLGEEVYKTKYTMEIPDGVNAIRLTYRFYADSTSNAPPFACDKLWIED